MDAMPWDSIAKLVGGLVVIVGGFYAIQKSGERKKAKKIAEQGNRDAKTVDEITGESLPTDAESIDELMSDR